MKKKLFYFLAFILFMSIFYLVYIKKDFYISKPYKIENTKQLTLSIVSEINKTVNIKDTLFLIVDNDFVTCGNETDNRTVFEKILTPLKYAIKSRYIFNKEASFEPIYKNNNNKIIVTGTTTSGGEGCDCFRSPIVSFDYKKVKEKNVFEIKYASIGKNKIDLSIINFNTGGEIKSFSLVLDKENWILD